MLNCHLQCLTVVLTTVKNTALMDNFALCIDIALKILKAPFLLNVMNTDEYYLKY